MALVINSNIASLNSQRQLVKSGMEQDQAMERLSSGKKINSAADDAAGLAISNRMTSQVNGLNRAVSNANDGASLIQTAEGALDESTNILQRMRELAIQSANGIYGDEDRATLDAEVQQLVAELDRISETTSFNGQNLLDGTLGETALQVGSEANQTISFSIDAMDADTLGLGSTSSDLSGARMVASGAIAEGDVQINGTGLAAFTQGTDNLETLLADINDNVAGVTAEAFNIVEGTTVGTGAIGATESVRITLGSVDGQADVQYDFTDIADMDALVTAINNKTGGNITAALNDTGALTLSNTTGGTISVEMDATATLGVFDAADTDPATVLGITDGDTNGAVFLGSIALSSDDPISITAGASGEVSDLNNLGFQQLEGGGNVTGGGLSSANQIAALTTGDLTINGVAISATDTDSLIGKVEAINAASSETGVTASATSADAYAADLSKDVLELTAGASFTAPDASLANIHGASALNIDGFGATADITLTITDGDGTHAVNIVGGTDYTANDEASFVAAINAEILAVSASAEAVAYIDANGALAFRNDTSATLSIDAGVTDDAAGILDAGLGLAAEGSATTNLASAALSGININGVDVSIADTVADGVVSSAELVTAINGASANTGVTAYIDDADQLHLFSESAITLDELSTGGDLLAILDMENAAGTNIVVGTASPTTTASAIVDAGAGGVGVGSININGTEVADLDFDAGLDGVVAQLNAVQGDTGVRASIDDNGQLALEGTSTITLTIGQENGLATAAALGLEFGQTANEFDSITVQASLELNSVSAGQSIAIEVTAAGATATGLQNQNTDLSSTVTGSALSSISVGTQAGANDAIDSIDNALETINGTRSELGAVSNRLDFTVSNLMNISENTAAARSRIVDADFAAETANLSRAQVLQQAASAMLAQANAAPQQVLSLLR